MDEIDEIKYAKTFIESLARGINPLTGEIIPDDEEVINNVKISRCLFYVADVLEKVCQGDYGKKENKAKTQIIIDSKELENFSFSDDGIAISEIVKRVNDIIGYNGRKLKRRLIITWLIENGFIEVCEINARKYKLPTEKGIGEGIYTEERFGYSGNYRVVLYNLNAQKMIINYLPDIVGDDVSVERQVKNNQGKPWSKEQEEELTKLFAEGLAVSEIANMMSRTVGGIKARLLRLGLISEN